MFDVGPHRIKETWIYW